MLCFLKVASCREWAKPTVSLFHTYYNGWATVFFSSLWWQDCIWVAMPFILTLTHLKRLSWEPIEHWKSVCTETSLSEWKKEVVKHWISSSPLELFYLKLSWTSKMLMNQFFKHLCLPQDIIYVESRNKHKRLLFFGWLICLAWLLRGDVFRVLFRKKC